MTINATIGTRPSEEQLASLVGGGDDDDATPDNGVQSGQQATASAIGLSVQPITPTIARGLGLTPGVGVVVGAVDPASDSAAKGLQRGDVILSANARSATHANAADGNCDYPG